VKEYLESSRAGKWLLIVDNMDDKTKLAIFNNYLPRSKDGIILFTTRLMEIAVSTARSDIIELHQMIPDEAKELLRRSLVHKELVKEEAVEARLLEELTYLPLAIVQATAYLNRNSNLTIRRYLDLLHGTDKDVVSLMSREFLDDTRYQGSGNAVATTWLVSFRQIQQTDPAAAQLLSFLACVEPKAIPQSLLPELESEEEQEFAIGTLVGFSFLARRGDDNIYDMHSLVHLATRIWIGNEGQMEKTILGALEHMEAVFTNDNHVNQQAWQSYFPHSIRLLEQSKEQHIKERFSLSYYVGLCLDEDRYFKEAIKCLEDVWEWDQRTLQEEDYDRLASEHNLARAYLDNRQIEEAIEMFEHIVEVQKRTLREEDHSRLALEHELARAYLDNRRIEEAIGLLEHVVEIEKALFAEDGPDCLISQDLLEEAYSRMRE
jgi:tetratricopeptide (TPR) repeat protein